MSTVFRLPDLGEGLTEAEVLDWRVAVGDHVAIDQIVVEVETAKAAVEVPIPVAGTVVELYAPAGATVAVGAPLIAVAAAPDAEAGSGNVLIGYGTGALAGPSRRRRRPTPVAAPRVISPVVRRLAKTHGVDLATLTPSGRGGIIVRRDVEAAIPSTVDSVGTRIPLRGVRRAIADKLVRSRTEIPDATTWVDVDATALLELRAELNRDATEPIGLLALLARICVAGLQRFPQLNAYVDTAREEIVQLPHVHLGFAAQTDRGLVVPVVHDAHRRTLADLAQALRERTEAARAGTLAPSHLTGGTFTLNNYGVFGVDGSTPIINHPEAALLGVGRVLPRPWVVDGQLAVRSVAQLSLAFDHRVCDGGVAGGFLRFVADCVERPQRLLLHL
ncbi:dihydrolipoamide acetyltransferase family protein [Phytohabitans rumicis]|uniref:Dihydrolipoamide acetyltransferase component of pyruvate dehydrogenase complex n=1 Tax=Phytohabitans rumicis TaxID=1076125 RepID=A0A6V8LJV7_9ACTN|nr:dihydrolipoamide acetyltransferase family protein [Phytohabitans rumicis]GFJ95158.1 dihydrolipoamide acetyltransferase component of pyruvate dehydrogenase complex [Phytohabitans rumicis]